MYRARGEDGREHQSGECLSQAGIQWQSRTVVERWPIAPREQLPLLAVRRHHILLGEACGQLRE